MNKDFYGYLPKFMGPLLDAIERSNSKKPWFEDAWNEYRKIAMTTDISRIPAPVKFFTDYPYKEAKKPVEKESTEQMIDFSKPAPQPAEEKKDEIAEKWNRDEEPSEYCTPVEEAPATVYPPREFQ